MPAYSCGVLSVLASALALAGSAAAFGIAPLRVRFCQPASLAVQSRTLRARRLILARDPAQKGATPHAVSEGACTGGSGIREYLGLRGAARPVALAVRAILTARDAKTIRKAITTVCDYHADRGKCDLPPYLLLAMMAACRATGDWRRCLSLLRKLSASMADSAESTTSSSSRSGDDPLLRDLAVCGAEGRCSRLETVAVLQEATSVAIAACARWGADAEAWALLDELERKASKVLENVAVSPALIASSSAGGLVRGEPAALSDGGEGASAVSLVATLRVWMAANGPLEAGTSKAGSSTKARAMSKRRRLQPLQKKGAHSAGQGGTGSGRGRKERAALLMRHNVPEAMIARLVGHPGPQNATLDTAPGVGEGCATDQGEGVAKTDSLSGRKAKALLVAQQRGSLWAQVVYIFFFCA